MAHVRLSVIDLETGQQPMTRTRRGHTCTLVMNGEIYNMHELKKELENLGVEFETSSDTEVMLLGYLVYGEGILSRLNGIFAAALWDEEKETLFLLQGRGMKSLLFTTKSQLYASEIKGLLRYPGIKARVDGEGLCEIFALGPAKTYGKGVFRDVREVLPGHSVTFGAGVSQEHGYWKLESCSQSI